MVRVLAVLVVAAACAHPAPPVVPSPPQARCLIPAITPYTPVHLECVEFPSGYCATTANAQALQAYMDEVAAVEVALEGCPAVARPAPLR